jgi:formylglycine-generating enzyme required for sulfatase activity
MSQPGGKFALLIGNSHFEDRGLDTLAAPWNDVVALDEALRDLGGFITLPLFNAGLEEARTKVTELFQGRQSDDLLLLYYTGHGLRDDHGDLYLALPKSRRETISASGLEADFIRRAMDRSPAERQVLILDCCHSGAFMEGRMRAKGADRLRRSDFDPEGRGRFILAASSANESAFEHDGESLFTRHLVDGLANGSAAPDKEWIAVGDLYRYLSRRISAEQAPMQPMLWAEGQAGELIVARNPNPRKPISAEMVALLWDEDHRRAHSAAMELIQICQENDPQRAADAEKTLRQRLETPETLPLFVAKPILDHLDPSGKELERMRAAVAEAGEARAQAEAEARELDAEIERQKTEAAAASERAEGLAAALESLRGEQGEAKDKIEHLEQRLAERPDGSGIGARFATVAAATFGRLFEPRGAVVAVALLAVIYASVDPDRFERMVDIAGRFLPFVEPSPTALVAELKSEVDVLRTQRDTEAARADAAEADLTTARARIAELEGAGSLTSGATQDECTETPADRCPPGSSFVEADRFPEMVVIPAGEFMMGSPETENGRNSSEGPQQEIAVARFALARSEVTFDQWEACVADGGCDGHEPNDFGFARGEHPVIDVSWDHARSYVDWLNSKIEGAPYRLPSEAEWEYAARAGESSAYPWGPNWDADQANGKRVVAETTEIRSYPANGFGLRDMIGNVWEWTEDCWRDNLRDQPMDGTAVMQGLGADCSRRVVRGGSWGAGPRLLRSADRNWVEPDGRSGLLGFRPARTLTP